MLPPEPFLCFSAPGRYLRLIAQLDQCASSCAGALISEGLRGVNVPGGLQVIPGLLLAVALFLSLYMWLCARSG